MGSTSVHAPMSLHLPFTPSSVSVARGRLRRWMSDIGGSGESIEDARVVISELVGNSVQHARPLADGSLLVTWTLDDGTVQVSVTDGGGSTAPRNLHSPSSAPNGRGMAIVDVLAQDWWTERCESRSTVHATLHV